MTEKKNKYYVTKTIASFLLVLCLMPLGHATMILMEHFIDKSNLPTVAFLMGFAGMLIVVAGVFVKGDTKQTLFGLFGGLFFWTGWVEFLFQYYAVRYGTQPEIEHGVIVTRPEYLILPATFGFWMMTLLLYLFSAKTGCDFINFWQRLFFRKKQPKIAVTPMTTHTSIVTFMELMMILWTSYLLLMFCYDPRFIGDHSPVTFAVGALCFIGSLFMIRSQLRIPSWGRNIRMSIATVIVFWTPVEILGRVNFFNEIWLEPMQHKTEMIIILTIFAALLAYLIWGMGRKNNAKRF